MRAHNIWTHKLHTISNALNLSLTHHTQSMQPERSFRCTGISSFCELYFNGPLYLSIHWNYVLAMHFAHAIFKSNVTPIPILMTLRDSPWFYYFFSGCKMFEKSTKWKLLPVSFSAFELSIALQHIDSQLHWSATCACGTWKFEKFLQYFSLCMNFGWQRMPVTQHTLSATSFFPLDRSVTFFFRDFKIWAQLNFV